MKRRDFIKRGVLFVPMIFIPRLIRGQNVLTADGVAAFSAQPNAGGGGGGGGTIFRTAGHGSTTRHDFAGYIGSKYAAAADITITDLGRMVISGNSAAHTVYLCNASGTVLQSASVSTAGGTPNADVFNSITPTAIGNGIIFFILSSETLNGDDWYNDNADLTTTADASIDSSRYTTTIGSAPTQSSAGARCFVPVNFKYTKP